MAIIFPADNHAAIGSALPDGAVDATELQRVEPLLTPDLLVQRHLFGIPLISALVDPITRKAAVMTPDMLRDYISQAVSRIETESGFQIAPMAMQRRLPFDRNEYLSLGYTQLPHRPVSSVQSLNIITANGDSVYQVPNNWIAPGHLHLGQFTIVPLQPAFLSSGYIPSTTAGGAAFIAILGAKQWIPEYWQVSYVAGFEDGKLPKIVNDLIGYDTAIEVLSMLQATHKASSTSLGIDGMSQSVSTPGPQVYAERIKDLQDRKKRAMNKIKALVGLNMFSSSV